MKARKSENQQFHVGQSSDGGWSQAQPLQHDPKADYHASATLWDAPSHPPRLSRSQGCRVALAQLDGGIASVLCDRTIFLS
jgi:hypothetical protein